MENSWKLYKKKKKNNKNWRTRSIFGRDFYEISRFTNITVEVGAEIKPIMPVNLRPPSPPHAIIIALESRPVDVWPLRGHTGCHASRKYLRPSKGSSESRSADFHSHWSILVLELTDRLAHHAFSDPRLPSTGTRLITLAISPFIANPLSLSFFKKKKKCL